MAVARLKQFILKEPNQNRNKSQALKFQNQNLEKVFKSFARIRAQ